MATAPVVPPVVVRAGGLLSRTTSMAHRGVQKSSVFHPLPGMQRVSTRLMSYSSEPAEVKRPD